MLTAKDFKEAGLVFVTDDEGVEFKVRNQDSFKRQKRHDSDVVVSFAWRPMSTLPDNPKFKYEVKMTGTRPTGWRPLLEQSAPSKPYDFAEHVSDASKPVFTQEMADENELPPIGSEVALAEDTGFYSEHHQEVLTSVVGSSVIVVWMATRPDNKAVNVTLFNGKGFVTINPDWVKPISTRTPKQKAVDEAMEDIDAEADDVTKVVGVIERMLAAGYHK